jgi:hypothetical protein
LQNTTFASETLITLKGNTLAAEQSYNDGGGIWMGAGVGLYDSNFDIAGGSLQLRSRNSWLILFTNAANPPTWVRSNLSISLSGSTGSLSITASATSEFRHFYLNLDNNTAASTLTLTNVRVAEPATFQILIRASTVNWIAFTKLRFQSRLKRSILERHRLGLDESD